MDRILVTPRSLTKDGHPSLDLLREAGYEIAFCSPGVQPTEEELMALLPGCVGYLAGVEPVTARVLASAAALRAISRNGTGIDNIDLEAARRSGIQILRTEGANACGVAELAIALLLSGLRSISSSDREMKAGRWTRSKGIEIRGRTLGIIGCGRIGRLLAEMAGALGMHVLAHDPFIDDAFHPSDQFRYAPLEEVIARSDAISLHAPASADGKPLIDAPAISRMKKGVFIINTARASLVDAQALLEGLNSGRVSGYATDVFEKEPPAPSPLLQHDRVIATPHIGGYTDESVERASRGAVENLIAYLAKA